MRRKGKLKQITHTRLTRRRCSRLGGTRMRISLLFRIEDPVKRGGHRCDRTAESQVQGWLYPRCLPNAAILSDLSLVPATFKASYLTQLFISFLLRPFPHCLSPSILSRYFVNTITSYHNEESPLLFFLSSIIRRIYTTWLAETRARAAIFYAGWCVSY